MAKQPLGGRPNKAALAKIKLATVLVSLVAFVGSLGGVAYLNPGSAKSTGALSQTQFVSVDASSSSSTSQVSGTASQPSVLQQASIVPLVRTRGS